MTEWIKSKYKGLRYREHLTKTTGVGRAKRPLRYYMMTFKFEGKTVSESLGWEGDYIKSEDHAQRINQQLQNNRKDKTPPFTLEELRKENETKQQEVEAEGLREKIKNLTFEDIFERFLEVSKQKKKNPRSWKREEQLARLHLFPVLGNIPLSKIAEVPHLRKIRNNMEGVELSPRTVRYALHVVRIVFNFAIDEGIYTGSNPAREESSKRISEKKAGIKYPQEDNTKDRYLSREEAVSLLKELAKRSEEVHDMSLLALYTGMRFGEIANLRWSDVNLFQGVIMLRKTKSGKNRPAYMNPDIQKMFARRGQGEPDSLVFPARGRDDKPHYMISHIYYDTVKKMFNEGIADKKKWVNFHTLRHTFASWLVEEGTDLYLVKDLMGHHDLKMTERYAHIGENRLKQAVMKLQK